MGENKTEKMSFIYDSFKGDVRYDLISEKPKEPSHLSLRISYDDRYPIRFAYEYGEGLVRVDKIVNKKRKTNILGEFLNIDYGDVNGYIDFFNEHGFLYELDHDRFLKLELIDIVKISKRLQALIDLINEVNKENADYDLHKIFGLSLALLLDEPWNIEIKKDETKTAVHFDLKALIENNDFISYDSLSKKDEFQNGYFTILDTIYGTNRLSAKDYRAIMDGSYSKKGGDDFYFKSITYLYANYHHTDKKSREVIDCLFHYYYEIGIPLNIEIGEPIKYYSKINEESVIVFNLHDPIINFAKYIIKNEIDGMIQNIRPVYNQESMQPDWRVDSLLSAMYFSLFFMDSKMEMLKRCKYCGRLFQVKRSSTTHLYCDSFCRNNAQQAKHRIRVKNKTE